MRDQLPLQLHFSKDCDADSSIPELYVAEEEESIESDDLDLSADRETDILAE